MKRRAERRKRERESLPAALEGLLELLRTHAESCGGDGGGEGEMTTSASRRFLVSRYCTRKSTHPSQHDIQTREEDAMAEEEEEEEQPTAAAAVEVARAPEGDDDNSSGGGDLAITGKGLHLLVRDIRASLKRLTQKRGAENKEELTNKKTRGEGGADVEDGTPAPTPAAELSAFDVFQVARRVPRCRSTPTSIEVAELCFIIHHATCPVGVHERRLKDGERRGADADGAAAGSSLRITEEDSPMLRYYHAEGRFASMVHGTAATEQQQGNTADDDEWQAFLSTINTPLPMTLRLHSNEKVLKAAALDWLREDEEGSGSAAIGRVVQPVLLAGRPAPELYGCTNEVYHQNRDAEYICRTLHSASAVSFQEVVSSLPVLALDVQPHHRVMDMCAAPGSKTLQALDEMLREGWTPGVARGVLVCNEKDRAKATQTLPARLKRYHAPNVLCMRCDGTHWPRVYRHVGHDSNDQDWGSLRFDRVICDVPCSGDGTVRKEPSVATTWSSGYVDSLVPTQTALLRRGVDLLEEGGVIVYSTCSLNVKEDEAVLCAVLEQLAPGEVELLDVSKRLADRGVSLLSTQGGVAAEAVMVDDRPTTAEGYHPSFVLRVLPQRDDTGGFFVAALRRVHVPHLTPPSSIERKLNQWIKGKLWRGVASASDEVWSGILHFYGLDAADCFTYSGSISSSNQGTKDEEEAESSGRLTPVYHLNPNGKPARRIVLITSGLSDVLLHSRPYKGPGVEVVAAGVRAFECYDDKFLPTAVCRWRATTEAVSFLAPRATRRRLHFCTADTPAHLALVKELLTTGSVFLPLYWECVFLSSSRSSSQSATHHPEGSEDKKDNRRTGRSSLWKEGSALGTAMEAVIAGQRTAEDVGPEMRAFPLREGEEDGAGATEEKESPMLLKDVEVGGVMIGIRRSLTVTEAEPEGLWWWISATLSQHKLEVAVDGSLRSFGRMHYCGGDGMPE